MHLDVKDRKILEQLELDARQSTAAIARKVGLSREVTAYRIRRLEQTGVINRYTLILNTAKLGYMAFKWYLELENADEEKLAEIIAWFKDDPNCAWIASCTGRWDLITVFLVKSPYQFQTAREQFLSKMHAHVRDSSFTLDLEVSHTKCLPDQSGKAPFFGGELGHMELDREDILCLIELTENPRSTVMDIARKTKLSADIVKSRIRRMKDSGLIQGSRADPDNPLRGISTYKILLDRKEAQHARFKALDSYLTQHRCVWDVIHCLGSWNMECNVDVDSSREFHGFIMDLKNRFADLIRGYDVVQIFDIPKFSFFPMGRLLLKQRRML
ncbi:MAG: winged helix-turn-helix transcriptional regulator [archaeon]